MKVRFVASILFTFLLTGFAQGQQRKQVQWKEYVYPDDGFALTLPSPPSINESPALPGATAYAIYSESDDSGFVLRVMHKKGNCASAIAKLKESVLSGNNASIDRSSVKEPSFDGNRGLEYMFKRNTTVAIDRLYCLNERLYYFTVNWPSGRPIPAAATRMLNSFRLVQQP